MALRKSLGDKTFDTANAVLLVLFCITIVGSLKG